MKELLKSKREVEEGKEENEVENYMTKKGKK
jgi:hypothetical protein